MVIPITSSKITSAVWGPYEEYIITGHENGEICHYDLKSGDKINSCKEHSKQINDLQLSRDMSMLISASKDTTAKVSVHLSSYLNYTLVLGYVFFLQCSYLYILHESPKTSFYCINIPHFVCIPVLVTHHIHYAVVIKGTF